MRIPPPAPAASAAKCNIACPQCQSPASSIAIALAAGPRRRRLRRLRQAGAAADDAVVLAFGDSLTFGTGADEARATRRSSRSSSAGAWCAPACPARSSAQALARLPAALDEHAPRLLLLCIGGNDFLRRLGNRQAEDNVRAMVQLAKAAASRCC